MIEVASKVNLCGSLHRILALEKLILSQIVRAAKFHKNECKKRPNANLELGLWRLSYDQPYTLSLNFHLDYANIQSVDKLVFLLFANQDVFEAPCRIRLSFVRAKIIRLICQMPVILDSS